MLSLDFQDSILLVVNKVMIEMIFLLGMDLLQHPIQAFFLDVERPNEVIIKIHPKTFFVVQSHADCPLPAMMNHCSAARLILPIGTNSLANETTQDRQITIEVKDSVSPDNLKWEVSEMKLMTM